MKSKTQQLEPTAAGHEVLSQLISRCSDILQTASFELRGDDGITCVYAAEQAGVREASGSTMFEAARKALLDVVSQLAVDESSFHPASADVSSHVAADESRTADDKERFQAKARNQTVGVTMPSAMKNELAALATRQGISLSEALRLLTAFGFDDFEERSLFVSHRTVFQTLGAELQKWHGGEAEQVMLRLEPEYVVRLKAAAKEHERSASEMGALCVAHGLAMSEQLKTIESSVQAFRGAALRRLPEKLGLEPHTAPLLAGVLAGSIRAPRELLRRLSSVFSAPDTLLAAYFRQSFDQRLVPSFKAGEGKPAISTSAIRWESAVKKSGFTAEQSKALLQLGA